MKKRRENIRFDSKYDGKGGGGTTRQNSVFEHFNVNFIERFNVEVVKFSDTTVPNYDNRCCVVLTFEWPLKEVAKSLMGGIHFSCLLGC